MIGSRLLAAACALLPIRAAAEEPMTKFVVGCSPEGRLDVGGCVVAHIARVSGRSLENAELNVAWRKPQPGALSLAVPATR